MVRPPTEPTTPPTIVPTGGPFEGLGLLDGIWVVEDLELEDAVPIELESILVEDERSLERSCNQGETYKHKRIKNLR